MLQATSPQQDTSKLDKSGSTYTWILLGLILLQWLLFRSYVLREIAWAYPVNHDQSVYLFLSYHHFETLLQNDFLSGLSTVIFTPNSNGILLHLQTIFLFLLFGASRLSALSINFLNFALYQVVFALVIKRMSGRQSLALLGAGLLLGTGTPFFWAGGIMDYRLDFAAFCLFGVFISVVIHSEIFRSRKWAIVAGLVAGLLVLTRFITAVYLAGIYGLMFVYFLSEELRRRPPQKTYDRVKNITLSGVAGAMVAAPFLWLNRAPIYGYYFILQQGPERFIRAKQFGAETWGPSLLYYPNSIIKDHFPINLVIVCLVLVLLSIGLAYALSKLQPLVAAKLISYPFRDTYIFLGVCFLVVLGVLTANTSKSPVVGGILVPVLLWLVILTFFFGVKGGLAANAPWFRAIGVAAAALCLGYGVYHQVANLGKHAPFTARLLEVKAIEQMIGVIGAYSEQMGWSTPPISTDSNADYLASRTLAVRYYEEHGVLIDFQHLLGGSIFAITTDDILEQLKRSDFVILTHAEVQSATYPFYESIKAARPQLETFVAEHFVHLGQYYIYENNVDLYGRPSFNITSGVSGDRLTSDRLLLNLPFPVATAASEIVLSGPLAPWVSPETTVSCVLLKGNQAVETLAVEFTATNDQYSIHCHLPDTLDTPNNADVQIGLNFSLHVVPEKMGSHENGGQIFVAAPSQKSVILKSSLIRSH